MPPSRDFLTVAPLVPAGPSLAAAMAFYTGQLCFTVTWQGPPPIGRRLNEDAHIDFHSPIGLIVV
jgi:hypothetical protein